MWLAYPIHEALATHQGKLIIKNKNKNKNTNEEYLIDHSPKLMNSEHQWACFQEYHKDSTQVNVQMWSRDTISIIQLPMQEKVNQETGLSDSFHMTICFDT